MGKKEIFSTIWMNDHNEKKAIELISDFLGITREEAKTIYFEEYLEYARQRDRIANSKSPEKTCQFYKSEKVCSALRKMYCTEEVCSFYKRKGV